jgi:hypothetical protein
MIVDRERHGQETHEENPPTPHNPTQGFDDDDINAAARIADMVSLLCLPVLRKYYRRLFVSVWWFRNATGTVTKSQPPIHSREYLLYAGQFGTSCSVRIPSVS